MEWTTGLVESSSLSQKVVVLQLVSEEFTRNVQSFSSDNDNLLTVQYLLGNSGGQTTQQMILSYNKRRKIKLVNANLGIFY